MCFTAIDSNMYNIQYIINPSINIQRSVTEFDVALIRFINKPKPSIQSFVIAQDLNSLHYILRPIDEVLKTMIK